ncbi:hypothetical protein REISMN_08015 [Rickettsia tamurae subsp. buchneri]|uniref:Uncharacterized protein n=1 Tax=Rickettsia tamurae subsp. buchneri TaxID=1462938 RepID=A0A8E0WKJ1_9RICK|nr:hypothetical protein REISMN_08015 [Rickettsia tamurae subsp. buchneri]
MRLIFGWNIAEQPELNPYDILSQQILPSDFSLFEEENSVRLNNDQIFLSLEASKRPS